MRPVGLEDILGRERYAAERDAIRRRIIAHKRTRRVALGDRLTLLFEDRATVWYQIQEMLWVERTTDLDAIRDELRVYNQLLPAPHELSTTLMIEIEDQARIRPELERLIGIDEHLVLEVGGERTAGVFEPGRQRADKLSAVQYVRFPLGADAERALVDGAALTLRVTHPSYEADVVLAGPVRAALAADLADPASVDAALRGVRDGI